MLRARFCLNGPNEMNGPNVWLARHLTLLKEYGIAPEILYLSAYPEKECYFRTKLTAAGVPCQGLQLNRFLEDNMEMIAEQVNKDPPDFFIPNYSVPAYFASRFLKETGVYTIGTLHSDDPYYHDIIDLFVAGASEWRLSAVAGVSEYLNTIVSEKAGRFIPYLHAPYGAPIPRIQSNHRAQNFRLLYSGRLVEWQKRIQRVVTAMVAAAKADDGVEGLIYGEGPEEKRITRLLGNIDCGNRIRLGGLIAPDKIQSEMLSAHAFVLLSDFEGLSIALMEAMACGLVPILSRMRSGVLDLIYDGINGFIIDGDDEDAFVKVVCQLSKDRELWLRMSNAARRTIEEKGLTSVACAQNWATFLKRLACEPRHRKALCMPVREMWGLPPRSQRKNGIRSVDRRCSLPRFVAALENGRPVFLWGAGRAGEMFLESIQNLVSSIAGFVDSDTAKHGKKLGGIPIYSPLYLDTLLRKSNRPFVMITSQFESEIEIVLQSYGLQEDDDYLAA